MTKYKISFHCGQVSSFAVEEHDCKANAFQKWREIVQNASSKNNLIEVGDVLINPEHVSFVVVEELIERTEEPAAGATIEV